MEPNYLKIWRNKTAQFNSSLQKANIKRGKLMLGRKATQIESESSPIPGLFNQVVFKSKKF